MTTPTSVPDFPAAFGSAAYRQAREDGTVVVTARSSTAAFCFAVVQIEACYGGDPDAYRSAIFAAVAAHCRDLFGAAAPAPAAAAVGSDSVAGTVAAAITASRLPWNPPPPAGTTVLVTESTGIVAPDGVSGDATQSIPIRATVHQRQPQPGRLRVVAGECSKPGGRLLEGDVFYADAWTIPGVWRP